MNVTATISIYQKKRTQMNLKFITGKFPHDFSRWFYWFELIFTNFCHFLRKKSLCLLNSRCRHFSKLSGQSESTEEPQNAWRVKSNEKRVVLKYFLFGYGSTHAKMTTTTQTAALQILNFQIPPPQAKYPQKNE